MSAPIESKEHAAHIDDSVIIPVGGLGTPLAAPPPAPSTRPVMSSAWTDASENILHQWMAVCASCAAIHQSDAIWYSRWDKALSGVAALLGAGTVSSILSTAGSKVAPYINGALAFVVTALPVLNKALGLNDLCVRHEVASYEYNGIGLDVQGLLALDRAARDIGPEEAIATTRKAIMDVRKKAPDINAPLLNAMLTNTNVGATSGGAVGVTAVEKANSDKQTVSSALAQQDEHRYLFQTDPTMFSAGKHIVNRNPTVASASTVELATAHVAV